MERNEKYLTLAEAAEYLKCGRTKLYTYAQAKKIPAAKWGNRWYFEASDLDKYISKFKSPVRIA